ncbi:phospholipid scramblase 2-like [Homalodisca vitripennis]|uniref:phospholipid scramblase 2-like n=1 Tax=Homalodisca vitripennis TaxID=197043 RepID=UPI001EEBD8C4|nr:phospholipid scramblase 2-like [Homalodisca vitripennis]
MSLPTDIPVSCPPGLEYLYYTDRLHIYKDMGIWEAIFGIRTKGKYKIRTKDIEQVYYAEEESNWFFRNCCDPSNPFGVKIVDRSNKEVIHLERPLACTFCCSPCCLQKLLVYFPPGHLAGTVEQEVQTSKFSIKDSAGATVLKIKGSDASDCCMSSHTAKLRILNLDGQVVGNIWKHWYNDEDPNSDLNYCGVTFLPTMNVRLKAILLGASFLMDSLYYGI